MRIVTWNTLWRFGEWEERQVLLADMLAAQAPDVVLLQETWPAQAEALAEAAGLQLLGFAGGYFDSTMSQVPTNEQFGNAILATAGRVVVEQPFTSPNDPAPRRLLGAEVDGLLLASVHLSHIAEAGSVRADQLREIVERLGQEGRPFVLAGDCNLVPSSSEYRTALGLGLTDVWATLRPGDHGATMVPANPEISHTAWMDDRNGDAAPPGTGVRLDYVWTSGDVPVASIDRFGDHDGPRWPSDHLGLRVALAT